MRRAVVICAALLGGCKDPEVEQLQHVKQLVCTCKTARCGEDALKQVPAPGEKPSRKAQQVARDMLDCLKKLYEADRPSTDPDAPTPPGTADHASARTP